jgi:hypothetical protein
MGRMYTGQTSDRFDEVCPNRPQGSTNIGVALRHNKKCSITAELAKQQNYAQLCTTQIQRSSCIDLVPQPRSALRAQASFTVSVLKSLPSASNTLATMALASRPARAYIAAGAS